MRITSEMGDILMSTGTASLRKNFIASIQNIKNKGILITECLFAVTG